MKIYNHLNTNLALIAGGNKSVIIPSKGLSDTIYIHTLSDNKLRLLLSKYRVKIDGQTERTYLRYHKIFFKEYVTLASTQTNTPASTIAEPTHEPDTKSDTCEDTAEQAKEQDSAIEDANQVQEARETATSAQCEASKAAHYVVEIIDLDD